MPSSARCCNLLAFILSFVRATTHEIDHPPVLPLTTFDTGQTQEDEKLVACSPQPSVNSESTIKTVECVSLLSCSSPAASPLLLTPPPLLDSPKLCPSLLDPSPQPAIGLGKRRGFKGAPLFTADLAKRQTSSFLASAKSPRTPLSAVTNLIRTPTTALKSPAIPVPETLQQLYWAEDPFSVSSESFYDPDVCGSIPFSALAQIDVYYVRKRRVFSRAMESACSTRPKLWATHVYDAMVYNFQPSRSGARSGSKSKPKEQGTAVRATIGVV